MLALKRTPPPLKLTKMLRRAQMTAKRKLHRSVESHCQSPQWAVREDHADGRSINAAMHPTAAMSPKQPVCRVFAEAAFGGPYDFTRPLAVLGCWERQTLRLVATNIENGKLMKCSVYIATSVDGFIARNDGGVDWLETAGKPEAGTGGDPYIDMASYMATVDCMIMGRKCMEMIASFNLTPEQWPYGSTRIIVLSRTLNEPSENLTGHVEMYSGDLLELVTKLENEGHSHAYIDGGKTIQSFINLQLIDEMTITQIPILLGEGKTLFGQVAQDVRLEGATAIACPSDYVQVHYKVRYV